MRRVKTTSLLALLLSASLTACASSDTPGAIERVYVRQEIPDSLLRCATEPPPPPRPVTEFGVLEYVARLRAALLDCRYRLERIAVLVAGGTPPPH